MAAKTRRVSSDCDITATYTIFLCTRVIRTQRVYYINILIYPVETLKRLQTLQNDRRFTTCDHFRVSVANDDLMDRPPPKVTASLQPRE